MAYSSDVWWPYLAFESFSDAQASILRVGWWGFDLRFEILRELSLEAKLRIVGLNSPTSHASLFHLSPRRSCLSVAHSRPRGSPHGKDHLS